MMKRPTRSTLAKSMGACALAAGLFGGGQALACISSEAEPNDAVSSANGPVCSATPVSGSLKDRGRRGSRDFSDFFALTTAGDGTLEISLNHHHRADFDLFLYDDGGAQLASARTTDNPEVIHFSATAGSYFVEVYTYDGSADYTLTAAFPDGSGGDDGGGNDGGGSCSYGSRPSAPGGLSTWLTGSADDVCASPTGPGVLLMGGNFDIDEAFQNRVAPVIDGGDVVVLRTSGSDGYNGYLDPLVGADSVETLLVDKRTHANSDYVDWAIRSAEFVWMAGGDQSDYLNQWQGTKVESAIEHVYAKGGVVGGISAGNAVSGEFIYDPDGVYGIYSSEAVSNPCHEYMNISTGFLDLPLMADIVTDTHFSQRNRMGRSLVFMARIGESGLLPDSGGITGLAVDEDTALYVDSDRVAHVDGDSAAYVLREDSQTQRTQVACGQPVIYSNVLRTRLAAGDTFDFGSGSTSGSTTRIGVDGTQCSISLTEGESCFYDPADPY